MLTKHKLNAYWLLMRADKPIGIYLLLWPTIWALWIAAQGPPSWPVLLVFVAGVIVMRSAGCVINDYADRKVDGLVKRTQKRPIASGEVSEKEALSLFVILIAVAFALVLSLNWQTIQLSFGALLLAAAYPFMKRYTYFPQVVLGAAFGWSIPMAFMAVNGHLSDVTWLLFVANVLWTTAYDTQYAMVDRDDDIKIGVKSTAVLFGQYDRLIIAILHLLSIMLLLIISIEQKLGWPMYAALVVCTVLFGYQSWLIRKRDRTACFKAFLHNHYVGLTLALGIIGHYLLAN
ncbi:MAG: 4-hydroxybenzoate polyprenyltransferase [Paraglaciecola sp.]|jgi:4-hydroxybenzoate polyprenyltransferase